MPSSIFCVRPDGAAPTYLRERHEHPAQIRPLVTVFSELEQDISFEVCIYTAIRNVLSHRIAKFLVRNTDVMIIPIKFLANHTRHGASILE